MQTALTATIEESDGTPINLETYFMASGPSNKVNFLPYDGSFFVYRNRHLNGNSYNLSYNVYPGGQGEALTLPYPAWPGPSVVTTLICRVQINALGFQGAPPFGPPGGPPEAPVPSVLQTTLHIRFETQLYAIHGRGGIVNPYYYFQGFMRTFSGIRFHYES
ncbi:MAG: hypothetical protein GY765_15835 [bacterium]|nr:hypothetical protein [bacterium]